MQAYTPSPSTSRSKSTIITFVMRSTPPRRPIAHTPKPIAVTTIVTKIFSGRFDTIPPNISPSSAAVLYCVIEPVTYLQKKIMNQPVMQV